MNDLIGKYTWTEAHEEVARILDRSTDPDLLWEAFNLLMGMVPADTLARLAEYLREDQEEEE